MKFKEGKIYIFFRKVKNYSFEGVLNHEEGSLKVDEEILSDSWGAKYICGDGEERAGLMWDQDYNSFDRWNKSAIYRELIEFVNVSIKEGHEVIVSESNEDSKYTDQDQEYILTEEISCDENDIH